MDETKSWWESLISFGEDLAKSWFQYDLSRRQIQAGYSPSFFWGGSFNQTTDTSGSQNYVSQVPMSSMNYMPILLLVAGAVIIFLLVRK